MVRHTSEISQEYTSATRARIVMSRSFLMRRDLKALRTELGVCAMQDVHTKQVAQLSDLIVLINGDLSKNDRKKLITLCTIDVHARDVVQRLIDERVENASAFQWQSQLRYSQHPTTKECQVYAIFACGVRSYCFGKGQWSNLSS